MYKSGLHLRLGLMKIKIMRLSEVSLRPSPETRDIEISDQSESLLALKLLNRLEDYEASLSDQKMPK